VSAFARSGGQPQMPSPVIRIAPRPSRFTARSPSNFQVAFVAIFVVDVESAPKTTSDIPAISAAPVTSVLPRNSRRVTPALSFRSEGFSHTYFQRTSTQITVNAPGARHLRFSLSYLLFFRSCIRTANASSRSLPKVIMPASCPAMTRIFLFRTSVCLKSCIISYASSGVP